MNPKGEAASRVFSGMVNFLEGIFADEGHHHQWSSPDELLVIDNWRVLHGRPKIPEMAIDRKLERFLIEQRV
jgi:alpha-ketoglutarate-dependent taurine dioxygenase